MALEFVMLGMFALQTGSSLFESVHDTVENAGDLQANVCKLTNKIKDYTDKYNQVLALNEQISDALQQQIIKDTQTVSDMSIVAKGKLLLHTQNYQLVQKFSVLLLILLISILVFKVIGISAIINNLLKRMIIAFINLFNR
jgi:hypothetical protein